MSTYAKMYFNMQMRFLPHSASTTRRFSFISQNSVKMPTHLTFMYRTNNFIYKSHYQFDEHVEISTFGKNA